MIDRLVRELQSDDDAIDVWADVDVRLAGTADDARVVAVTCAVISAGFAADCGHSDEAVSYLAVRSTTLEQRFRFGLLRAADSTTKRTQNEMVGSLLAAIDDRDRATCEHSRAVGLWCGRIAKTIGLGSELQEKAALAGTLHDIGKIATPREILLKPGALDPAEWEVMRAHAQIGGQMLECIPSLEELAPIVRSHHERMDGKGYPDGLAGEAIPQLSRIVAVADAFHAMISKRPYRTPLPIGDAVDELRAGSGTQWDRPVVAAMLDIVAPARARKALHAVAVAR
ncbi:MAG: HD-GYP domain-containing protein [Candidatus Eremiobacteraeota bacterium]|nr:HD-GYP domain-containing protein [Candidatus Eremiobacteraeota bacterium]